MFCKSALRTFIWILSSQSVVQIWNQVIGLSVTSLVQFNKFLLYGCRKMALSFSQITETEIFNICVKCFTANFDSQRSVLMCWISCFSYMSLNFNAKFAVSLSACERVTDGQTLFLLWFICRTGFWFPILLQLLSHCFICMWSVIVWEQVDFVRHNEKYVYSQKF